MGIARNFKSGGMALYRQRAVQVTVGEADLPWLGTGSEPSPSIPNNREREANCTHRKNAKSKIPSGKSVCPLIPLYVSMTRNSEDGGFECAAQTLQCDLALSHQLEGYSR